MPVVPVVAAGVRDAYLQAPISEEKIIICGPEFGIENNVKKSVIIRVVYGGKADENDFGITLGAALNS